MASSGLMAIALMLTANTGQASKAIDRFASKSQKRIAELNEKAARLSQSATSKFKNAAIIAAPIIAATKEAMALNTEVSKVGKELGLLGNKDAMNKLNQQAIRLSNNTGDSALEMSKLMGTLVAAGVGEKELEAMALKSDDLSKALDITKETAGQAYQGIRRAMNLTGKDADLVMDAITTSISQFGGHAENAFVLLTKEGSQATKALRFTNKELVALANAAEQSGVEGDKMANILNKFHRQLIDPKNADLRKIFVDAGGGAQGFMKVMEKANKSGNAFAFFASRGFTRQAGDLQKLAANMNTGSGLANQTKFINSTNVSGGVAKKAALMNQTSEELMKQAISQIKNTGLTLGQTLLPVVADILNKIQPLLSAFSKFAAQNPGVIKGIGAAALAIAGLKAATGTAQWFGAGFLKARAGFVKTRDLINKTTKAVKDYRVALAISRESKKFAGQATLFEKVGGGLKKFGNIAKTGVTKGIQGIGKAFSAVGKLLMANPWIIVITLIAGAVYLIIKNWDKVKAFFIKLWTGVKKIFSATWQWIKHMFLNYTPYGLIIKHWDKITAFFSGLWEKVKGLFSAFWDWITGWADTFKEAGVNLVLNIWEGIKAKWTWLVEKAKGLWNKFKGWFGFGDKSTAETAVNMSSPGASGANMYRMAPSAPQLAPVRAGSNDQFSFAPVINVSGSMNTADTQRMTAQMRRDFERQMSDYQYNKQRKGF